MPGFIASIVAYSIYCIVNHAWGPIFSVPNLQFNHPVELPLYLALGAFCAGVGSLYVWIFYSIRDWFRRLSVPRHVKPALGGLAVGLIGFYLPAALGMGYGWVQRVIDGSLPLDLLVALVLAKIAVTGLTIGSGGSGGVFAPSVMIGGCLGGVAGSLFHHFLPNIVTHPTAFVLVGMAGFFAGVAKAPLSAIVMVSEMTMGYGLLVPLMLATAAAFLLSPRGLSIYEEQVTSPVESPAHEGEFATSVLEQIHVNDVINRAVPFTAFQRGTPLREILTVAINTAQGVFPICRDSEITGVIDLQNMQIFLTERKILPYLLVAEDLAAPVYRVVSLDEDLLSALRNSWPLSSKNCRSSAPRIPRPQLRCSPAGRSLALITADRTPTTCRPRRCRPRRMGRCPPGHRPRRRDGCEPYLPFPLPLPLSILKAPCSAAPSACHFVCWGFRSSWIFRSC